MEALKQVRDDGVFFWATHGGSLQPGAGEVEYALWTRTTAYKETVEVDYADDADILSVHDREYLNKLPGVVNALPVPGKPRTLAAKDLLVEFRSRTAILSVAAIAGTSSNLRIG